MSAAPLGPAGPGVNPVPTAGRDTTGLGNAWGSHGGSLIRTILNAVIPVTIVERWYGEAEGSLFGITAGVGHLAGHRPSIEFFSDRVDWELHSLNIWYPQQAVKAPGPSPTEFRVVTSLFTAPGNYNPIEVAPTAEFGPQLVTNTSFTQGAVRGQGGHNAFNSPNGLGYTLSDWTSVYGVLGSGTIDNVSDQMEREYLNVLSERRMVGWQKHLENYIHFPRPIRMRRGRRLTIQLQMENFTTNGTPGFPLQVSALYSELPNPRGEYLTP